MASAAVEAPVAHSLEAAPDLADMIGGLVAVVVANGCSAHLV